LKLSSITLVMTPTPIDSIRPHQYTYITNCATAEGTTEGWPVYMYNSMLCCATAQQICWAVSIRYVTNVA